MDSALQKSAILLIVLAMIVIIAGAVITSTEVTAKQLETTVSGVVDTGLHRLLGISLTVLMLGFTIFAATRAAAGWIKTAASFAFAILAMDAALGWTGAPLSPGLGVLHALLAHLFLTIVTAIALGTSTRWSLSPELVDGSSKPLLRPLAIATPPVVFLQITLGSAYRHDMTSVMPHMGIAMAVAFMALIGSSMVLQNFPKPAALRRAAGALIAIVLTQVSLGIGAFLMLVLNSAGSIYFVLITVAHVAVGATTQAATVVMAMEIWRSVVPKPARSVLQRVE